MKQMLLAVVLLTAGIASAKTYSLTVHGPALIGGSQVKGGDYRLELKGDRVLLKDGNMVNEFPVQVQNEARKFNSTSVTYTSQDGATRIQEIHLGGTTVKLVFNN